MRACSSCLSRRRTSGGFSRMRSPPRCSSTKPNCSCPTFQQIGETLLHLTPQLDGIDIGHSLHKVYALAPGDHRRHRRKLRHVLAVGPCGGASQRAALFLCKLRYPSSDSQAGSQAFNVPFERAGQCFVEIVEVKDRRAFRRGIGAKICEVGVATRLQPNPGARHARKIGSHDSRSATEERERGQPACGNSARAANPESGSSPAQPGWRLDLSDLLAVPTQRGRSAAVAAAGRVPPCVSRPVAQSGWRGVNVQDFGPCLSPCHCRRQDRVLYSTFRGT